MQRVLNILIGDNRKRKHVREKYYMYIVYSRLHVGLKLVRTK